MLDVPSRFCQPRAMTHTTPATPDRQSQPTSEEHTKDDCHSGAAPEKQPYHANRATLGIIAAFGCALLLLFWRHARELVIPTTAVLLALRQSVTKGKTPTLSHHNSSRHYGWIGLSLFVICLMLIYHFPVREFYYDSSAQIEIGNATRDAHFRVTIGQQSGAGIPNPPLFAYIMGAATWLTADPKPITAVISAIHVLTVAGTLLLIWKSFSLLYASLIALLMAASPGIILYANLLWEGSTLIPLSALLFFCLYQFATSQKRRYFIGATVAVTLAAQSHQTGFFLYPVLTIVGLYHIRTLKLSGVMGALLLCILLSAPYLYYMLFQSGLTHLSGSAGGGASALHPRTVLFATMGVFSLFHAHYTYHGRGFPAFLDRSAGIMGTPLYTASLVITVLFITGWLAYLIYAVRNRKLMGFRPEHAAHVPMPVQIAGLTTTLVFIAYALFLPYIWFKHLIILFPGYFILAAWPAWRFWHNRAIRIVFATGVLAAVVLMPLMFRTIDRMGGSYARGAIQDYQLSYQTIEKIRDRVWEVTPANQTPLIYTSGYWPGPLQTVIFSQPRPQHYPGIPLFLRIQWSTTARRHLWDVYPISAAYQQHQQAMELITSQIPPHTTVATSNIQAYPLHAQPSTLQHWPDTIQSVALDTNTLFTAPFVAIDTFAPWARTQWKTSDVFDLLRNNSELRLKAAQNGMYLFERNPTHALTIPELLEAGLPFPEFRESFTTGSLIADEAAPFGVARFATPAQDRRGFMAYGPYIFLPEGNYVAEFHFKTDRITESPILTLDVFAEGGRIELASQSVQTVPSANQWHVVQLDVNIPPGGLHAVELRAQYTRKASVWLRPPKLRTQSN